VSAAPKLQVEGLAKRFGERVVLDGIDLAVDEHEVVCLIGPSGSGKSTILRCIDLLDPPDAGRILLDGDDITAPGVNANSVRKRVGIVFQSFNLFPHLTIIDNVTLGPRKVLKQSKADAEGRALELLERLGLADHRTKYPEQLSGGQQQRVALARALITDPEVLLLDEVTSALDPELVGDVLAAIRELADEGMTMVIATHEMGFAREVADQLAFIHEGRVLESGPPAQVLAEPEQPRTRQFLARVIEAGRL
jgi:polar amino acid transport system ATP-binding protein